MAVQHTEKRFLEIYDRYADAIFRFCVVRVTDREIAKDLTQDTFMRFWDTLRKGDEVTYPKTMLYTIARNRIIDHYRKHKSESLELLSERGYEPVSKIADAASQSECQEVIEAIQRLPEQYRDVVYLRFAEGLPPRDIATICSEPVNRTSVRITRGLKELRNVLRIDTV